MTSQKLVAILLVALPLGSGSRAGDAEDSYQPAPENLAARQWFQDAKFGVFIHWGCSSVLESGEWVMHQQKIPVAEYKQRTAARFDPVDYDPAEWVALFK